MLLGDCYISYLNLDHRTDRLELIEQELSKAGLKAERTRGKMPREFDLSAPELQRMRMRTPGAVGCHYGQVAIMKGAHMRDKHAFVLEDDAQFCQDFKERMVYMDAFLEGKEWDVLWLGGTVHMDVPWWHQTGHPEMTDCPCTLNKDFDITDDPRVIKTYGAFSTFAYIVNKKNIRKILGMFDTHLSNSIGIDYLFIRIQPELNTYMHIPGMVRQRDNQSDIGTGWTIFSGFSKLGPHWYSDKM